MRFEDLEIWKLSIDLSKDLWKIFYNKDFKNYNFQDQIMRATISISNNIAEWYERNTNKEMKMFLYYAKWSCWEIISMLYLAKEFWYIDQNIFDKFYKNTITISVKINNFIKTLK